MVYSGPVYKFGLKKNGKRPSLIDCMGIDYTKIRGRPRGRPPYTVPPVRVETPNHELFRGVAAAD